MPEPTNQLRRREFLKHAAHAAAAGLAGGAVSAAVPKDKKLTLADTIPARVFGKTGVRLPILGYGGAALPKRWHNPLTHEDRVKLVRYAYARGLRYFDTAGNYMESQRILGEALQPMRDQVWLASKVETTVPSQARKAVERCLEELKTDYLDLVQIHGTPGLEQMSVARAMQVHAELVKLRDERIVRFLGLTAHGYFDKALALIESGGFDQCMLSYGYLPRGHNQVHSPRSIRLREQCLAKAHEQRMGIVAMKVMGAGILGAWAGYVVPKFDKGRLRLLPAAAIRHVLQDKRVHMLCIGMRLKADIDANIKTLAGDLTYTDADRARLGEDLDRCPLSRHAPVLEDEAVVRQRDQLGSPVRDEQHRDSQLALGLEEQREHFSCQLRVERRGRLVEQQHPRPREPRPTERDALALSPGQGVGRAIEERRQAQDLEHACAVRTLELLLRARREGQVLADRQVREQQRVLGDEGEAASLRWQPAASRALREELAPHAHLAARRLREPGERVQQRRLAGTGASEHAEHGSS